MTLCSLYKKSGLSPSGFIVTLIRINPYLFKPHLQVLGVHFSVICLLVPII